MKTSFKISNKLKSVLTAIGVIAVAGAVLLLMSFASSRHETVVCKGIVVNIEDENLKGFIDRSDIMEMVRSKGHKILGNKVVDINTSVLENILDANPHILKAEVYSTIDGWVHIDVQQRNPIARIINTKEENYYIDEQGKFMPLSEKYAEPVIVASGFINEGYAQQQISVNPTDLNLPDDSLQKLPVLSQVFLLAQKLQSDPSWDAMFEQIYVNENGEIELIPRLGNQYILIGDVSRLDEKLDKLHNLYLHGFPATGWEQYESINLKYKNQVVCKKKNNSSL
jgi:cell division protein FtsQ